MPHSATVIGSSKGRFLRVLIGKKTYLSDLASDVGQWALRLLKDLKEYGVLIDKIGTSGYNVFLTDRRKDVPIAELRWAGEKDLATMTIDSSTKYGRQLMKQDYQPFSQY